MPIPARKLSSPAACNGLKLAPLRPDPVSDPAAFLFTEPQCALILAMAAHAATTPAELLDRLITTEAKRIGLGRLVRAVADHRGL